MIYLSIPEGMKFKQIRIKKVKDITSKEKTEKIEVEVTNDFFVGSHDKRIDIQTILKEALRQNEKRRRTIKTSEFTIYLDNPPNTDEQFVEYKLKNNGKHSTDAFEVKLGKDCQRFHSQLFTRYGGRWSDCLPLTVEEKYKLKIDLAAQRDDRQKVGNSPKSN